MFHISISCYNPYFILNPSLLFTDSLFVLSHHIHNFIIFYASLFFISLRVRKIIIYDTYICSDSHFFFLFFTNLIISFSKIWICYYCLTKKKVKHIFFYSDFYNISILKNSSLIWLACELTFEFHNVLLLSFA